MADSDSRDDSGTAGEQETVVVSWEDVVKHDTAAASSVSAPARQGGLTPVRVSASQAVLAGEPAGFWLRVLAKILDLLVILLPFGILSGALGLCQLLKVLDFGFLVTDAARPQTLGSLLLAYVACYCVYNIVCHAANGRTVGKCICGIAVAPAESPSSMELYYFARLIVAALGMPLLGIGYLVAGFRRDKRALHDLVVGSQVVRKRHDG